MVKRLRGICGGHCCMIKQLLFLVISIIYTTSYATASCENNKLTIFNAISKHEFYVEIADDPTKRANGLMFKKSLSDFDGMVFLYDKPSRLVFWMKNTLIPLDIIFFDERGIIKKIYVDATPLSQKKIFGGSDLIGALEINGNLTSKLGFSEGDSIQFNRLNSKNTVWPCY